jgi:protein arginine N-methyltransferase 1
VDIVEMRAVVTDPAAVISIDLNTVTTADLAFEAPFKLDVRRNDFIHALIAWFDIDFTACHKPIKFSTGPHTKYTHWKQTVFYLQEVLTVEQGEEVQGVLSSRPNDKNKRDLDIAISYSFDANDPNRSTAGSCEYRM